MPEGSQPQFAQVRPIRPTPQRSPSKFAVPKPRAPSVNSLHMKKVQRDFDSLYRQSPVPRIVSPHPRLHGDDARVDPSASSSAQPAPFAAPARPIPVLQQPQPVVVQPAAPVPAAAQTAGATATAAVAASKPSEPAPSSDPPEKAAQPSPKGPAVVKPPRCLTQLQDFTVSGSKDFAPSPANKALPTRQTRSTAVATQALASPAAAGPALRGRSAAAGSEHTQNLRKVAPQASGKRPKPATPVPRQSKPASPAGSPSKATPAKGVCTKHAVCGKPQGHIGRCRTGATPSPAVPKKSPALKPAVSREARSWNLSGHVWIGVQVAKPGGSQGMVTKWSEQPGSETLWHVEYSDGLTEQLDEESTRELLVKLPQPSAAEATEHTEDAAAAAAAEGTENDPGMGEHTANNDVGEDKADAVGEDNADAAGEDNADAAGEDNADAAGEDAGDDDGSPAGPSPLKSRSKKSRTLHSDSGGGSDAAEQAPAESSDSESSEEEPPKKKPAPKARASNPGGNRARLQSRYFARDEDQIGSPQVALPDGANASEYGVSRSRSTGRVRTRPLEFWNNERPDYQMDASGTRMLVAVTAVPQEARERRPAKRKKSSGQKKALEHKTGPTRKRSLEELKAMGAKVVKSAVNAITPLKEYGSDDESSTSSSSAVDEHSSGEPSPPRKFARRQPASKQRTVMVDKSSSGGTKQLKARRPATKPKAVPMQPAGSAWTAQDRSVLQKAYVNVDPSHPSFWKAVAKQVGKPASECAEEWQQLHKKTTRTKQVSKRAQLQAQDIVVAKKGTLTHKRQVRNLVEHVNDGHKDDMFGKAAVGVTFSGIDEDDDEQLPRVFAAGSDGESDGQSSPGLLKKLDHDGFDPYISKFKSKTKRSQKVQPKKVAVAKRTGAAKPKPHIPAAKPAPEEEDDADDDADDADLEPGDYYWSE